MKDKKTQVFALGGLPSFAVTFKNNVYLALFKKGFYYVKFFLFLCCTI